jgi:hypothetical protein
MINSRSGRPRRHARRPSASSRRGAVLAAVSRAAIAAIAGGFAAAGIAGCAAAGPFNPDNPAAERAAGVGNICRSVVRVEPMSAGYYACVHSLSDSMREAGRNRAMDQARAGCVDRGYRPGSPDMAVCVLQSSRAGSTTVPDLAIRDAGDEPAPSKSYAYASQRDEFRREQLSCARLGLDPGTGAFQSCVAGLDSSLFDADNPSQ